jgi:membrane associated rhomboid family serine protease
MTEKRDPLREDDYAMSEAGLHPLETILRLCDAAAPQPWYPRLYVKQAGVDARELGLCLEELWLSGLIERHRGDDESGPAITLTREGQRVLLDPEALQRLREGQPVSAEDRAGIIRQALQSRARPFFTIALILIHVLVFVVGYLAAREQHLDSAFLRGAVEVRPPVTREDVKKQEAFRRLQEACGALSAERLLDGQWWRLVTAGFVHFGALSLLLTVVFVYAAGRFVEQTWGHVRFPLIYLASVAGGCCLGIAHNAGLTAGVSGGLGGLLGAEALWFFLNFRYLPRMLRRQARTNFLVTLTLLVVIGFLGGGDTWGWVGDAGAGTLTALLLQLHRFGPPLWRWLALIGFAPLLWYGHHVLVKARATDPNWQKVEDRQFEKRYLSAVLDGVKRARVAYDEKVALVLEKHPTRRDAAAVESALAALSEQQTELNAVAEQLARAGPYGSAEAEAARRVGRDYVLAVADWLAAAEHLLRIGDKRTHKDQKELREKQERAEKLHDQWNALLEMK